MTGWQIVGTVVLALFGAAFLWFVIDTVGAAGAALLLACLLAVVAFVATLGLALGGWSP